MVVTGMAAETLTIGAKLAQALVAAQQAMKMPKLDSENPYFSSRYASLGTCRDAAIPACNAHGIFVAQDLTTTHLPGKDGQVMLATECYTLFIHESGEGLRLGPLVMPAKDPTAQALGSAVTYARRYALQPAVGMVADEDEDGNLATGHPSNTASTPARVSNDRVSNDDGLPLRPTGVFGYGKKFVTVPWSLMKVNDLEWFRDADRTPPVIRQKCIAELTWRARELAKADAVRDQQHGEAPIEEDVPF